MGFPRSQKPSSALWGGTPIFRAAKPSWVITACLRTGQQMAYWGTTDGFYRWGLLGYHMICQPMRYPKWVNKSWLCRLNKWPWHTLPKAGMIMTNPQWDPVGAERYGEKTQFFTCHEFWLVQDLKRWLPHILSHAAFIEPGFSHWNCHKNAIKQAISPKVRPTFWRALIGPPADRWRSTALRTHGPEEPWAAPGNFAETCGPAGPAGPGGPT